MSVSDVGAGRQGKAAGQRRRARRLLERTGQGVIDSTRSLLLVLSIAAAVVWQSLRPLTWRRTVRHEFIDQCYRIGLKSLLFTVVVGVLVGLGLVYQLLSWLGFLGENELIGGLLFPVLAREMAPIVAGLIVLGRNGSVMVVELGNRKAGGQVHMLDTQGIDPFLFLVVPRVLAAALSTFCLAIILVAVGVGSGFVLSNALGATALNFSAFTDLLLQGVRPADVGVVLLKSVTIGFVVGLLSCMTGLSERAGRTPAGSLIPRNFGRSLLAILLISGFFTLLV